MSHYCAIDDVEEPDEGFRHCYECGHTYVTEKELVDEYNTTAERDVEPEHIWKATSGKDVTFCPLCLHDFWD